MRYALPIIMILSLMNIYHVLKPVQSDGGEVMAAPREYRFNVERQLELMKAQDEILVLKMLLNGYREANTHKLRLSAYTLRTEECNDDLDNTAVMQTPKPGWTVAVSRDLKSWLGKRIYIEGHGVRLVNDLMNTRYSKSIDILMTDLEQAREIGVKKDVLVTLIEPLAMDAEDIDQDLIALLLQ